MFTKRSTYVGGAVGESSRAPDSTIHHSPLIYLYTINSLLIRRTMLAVDKQDLVLPDLHPSSSHPKVSIVWSCRSQNRGCAPHHSRSRFSSAALAREATSWLFMYSKSLSHYFQSLFLYGVTAQHVNVPSSTFIVRILLIRFEHVRLPSYLALLILLD